MKHKLYIIIYLLILLVVGCSQSVNREYESNNMYFAEDSVDNSNTISSGIEQDSLSALYLEVFEKRIVQKLEDFTGYLEILSDTTLDKSFRDQAQIMAIDLFSSSNTLVFIDSYGNNIEKPQGVSAFVKSFSYSQQSRLSFKTDSVTITQKLKKVNDGLFEGKLQCILSIRMVGNKDENKQIQLRIKFELKRITKDFGGLEKDVWEVFLGDFGII